MENDELDYQVFVTYQVFRGKKQSRLGNTIMNINVAADDDGWLPKGLTADSMRLIRSFIANGEEVEEDKVLIYNVIVLEKKPEVGGSE